MLTKPRWFYTFSFHIQSLAMSLREDIENGRRSSIMKPRTKSHIQNNGTFILEILKWKLAQIHLQATLYNHSNLIFVKIIIDFDDTVNFKVNMCAFYMQNSKYSTELYKTYINILMASIICSLCIRSILDILVP